MKFDTGGEIRGHDATEAASWTATSRFCRDEFLKRLSEALGRRVDIVPMRLPDVCACLWLGFTGLDQLGFNPDWPGHELTLTAHAIGHLALGHCGTVRDGGQFACLPVRLRLEPCDYDRLHGLLHDPVDRLSRMFSDREEKAAEAFAIVLGEPLGWRYGGELVRETSRPHAGFVCLG